ncbi:hypothetical protein GCM10029992_39070 [Glycomyces albus]
MGASAPFSPPPPLPESESVENQLHPAAEAVSAVPPATTRPRRVTVGSGHGPAPVFFWLRLWKSMLDWGL